jgi:hypothetical protein
MIKTQSDGNNSQNFEININEKRSNTLVIFFQKQQQLPTLNIPDMDLILISDTESELEEGDIQSNFFCKSVCYVSKATFSDIICHKKKMKHLNLQDFSAGLTEKQENIKACFLACAIAFELDLLPPKKDIMVISGTGRYLDTLLLLQPSGLSKLNSIKIIENLCLPETE